MIHRTFIRIPPSRVGVLIGKAGSVKQRIESEFGVKLYIDGNSGGVEIVLDEGSKPVSDMITAKNIVYAIGLGFSPEKAFSLAKEDVLFEVIDLEKDLGVEGTHVERLLGRVIGRDGKIRSLIEELTSCYISVSDELKTIAVIGSGDGFEVARQAIRMLLEGRQHSTVFKYLFRERRRIKRMELEFWRTPELG
ncbi:MAG: KH domain-containing protein [Candidatus Bathyarchaeia archaeon]